jgi:hypothetical protein
MKAALKRRMSIAELAAFLLAAAIEDANKRK